MGCIGQFQSLTNINSSLQSPQIISLAFGLRIKTPYRLAKKIEKIRRLGILSSEWSFTVVLLSVINIYTSVM